MKGQIPKRQKAKRRSDSGIRRAKEKKRNMSMTFNLVWIVKWLEHSIYRVGDLNSQKGTTHIARTLIMDNLIELERVDDETLSAHTCVCPTNACVCQSHAGVSKMCNIYLTWTKILIQIKKFKVVAPKKSQRADAKKLMVNAGVCLTHDGVLRTQVGVSKTCNIDLTWTENEFK